MLWYSFIERPFPTDTEINFKISKLKKRTRSWDNQVTSISAAMLENQSFALNKENIYFKVLPLVVQEGSFHLRDKKLVKD